MTTGPQIYAAMAKLRWPNYRVEQNGKWAVVLHCANRVYLTDSYLEAQTVYAQACNRGACTHVALGASYKMHRIYDLDSQPSPQNNAGHQAFSTGYGR